MSSWHNYPAHGHLISGVFVQYLSQVIDVQPLSLLLPFPTLSDLPSAVWWSDTPWLTSNSGMIAVFNVSSGAITCPYLGYISLLAKPSVVQCDFFWGIQWVELLLLVLPELCLRWVYHVRDWACWDAVIINIRSCWISPELCRQQISFVHMSFCWTLKAPPQIGQCVLVRRKVRGENTL